MSPIPLHTTTIAVLRKPPDETRDPYDAQPDPVAVATGVRAHFSSPSGSEVVRGGSQSEVSDKLTADPVELLHTDQVLDESTGEVYDVVFVRQHRGLGLDHTAAGVVQVKGQA